METKSESSACVQDEKTAKLLAYLKGRLYAHDMSRARKAAHQLAWMQEAGFEILKEALFDRRSESLKVAAAYGLRRMRGRMKKMAMEALLEGLSSQNDITRDVCKKTALLLNRTQMKSNAGSNRFAGKFNGSRYSNARSTSVYARS